MPYCPSTVMNFAKQLHDTYKVEQYLNDLSKLPNTFAHLRKAVAVKSQHDEASNSGNIQEIRATALFGETILVWAKDAYECHAHCLEHSGAAYQADTSGFQDKLLNNSTFGEFKNTVKGARMALALAWCFLFPGQLQYCWNLFEAQMGSGNHAAIWSMKLSDPSSGSAHALERLIAEIAPIVPVLEFQKPPHSQACVEEELVIHQYIE